MVRKAAAGLPAIITSKQATELLMLSHQRLDQLAQAGWITRERPGRWDARKLVQDYIKFMRDEGRRSTVKAGDARVRQARAHEIEVRTAERLHHLIPIDDHFAVIDGLCGLVRSEMGGMPARATRDLVQRRSLEQEVNGSLERIANHCDAEAAKLAAGRDAAAPVENGNAGPVGGEQPQLPAVGTDTGSA